MVVPREVWLPWLEAKVRKEMMHTTKLPGGWWAQHSGDFSGTVMLGNDFEKDRMYTVPFSALKCLVAIWVKQKRMERLGSEDEANAILLPEIPILDLGKTIRT